MITPETKYHHGQQVIVLTEEGAYKTRGAIVGVNHCAPPRYDVLPRGEMSLGKTIRNLEESRLRPVAKPILAYERPVPGVPRHLRDDL